MSVAVEASPPEPAATAEVPVEPPVDVLQSEIEEPPEPMLFEWAEEDDSILNPPEPMLPEFGAEAFAPPLVLEVVAPAAEPVVETPVETPVLAPAVAAVEPVVAAVVESAPVEAPVEIPEVAAPDQPAEPSLTPQQREQVQAAFATFASATPPALSACLMWGETGAVLESYFRDGGPPFDTDSLARIYQATRPVVERQRLGDGRHVAITGVEGALLMWPMAASGFVLVIQLAGAYPFWPAETAISECELSLRAAFT
jgi:hypothetical protein